MLHVVGLGGRVLRCGQLRRGEARGQGHGAGGGPRERCQGHPDRRRRAVVRRGADNG